MLLPTTLPSARSACPAHAAPTLTASSGALVPYATTVRPMTSGDTPAAPASRTAPRTSASAPAHEQHQPDNEQDARYQHGLLLTRPPPQGTGEDVHATAHDVWPSYHPPPMYVLVQSGAAFQHPASRGDGVL